MVMVDFVDFVQLEGRQYLADRKAKAVPADIGAVVGAVTCELSTLKYTEAPGPSADGDAAFLTKGTEVYAVRGFDPSCRVAAKVEGAYRVYLAHHDVNGVSQPVPCASG